VANLLPLLRRDITVNLSLRRKFQWRHRLRRHVGSMPFLQSKPLASMRAVTKFSARGSLEPEEAGQIKDGEVRARRRLVDAEQHAVVQADCNRLWDSRAVQFPSARLWVHSRKQPERVGCAWAVEM
jgi:hypothetical protein